MTALFVVPRFRHST